MKIIQKLKDRHNIFTIFLLIIFLIISFRLASLTIVHGDEYRQISDTKRMRQLPVTAPRGEIRDRYGRLLAGNKPSFTVQIMKDEINVTDVNKRNNTLLNLVKMLEEDGVNYTDEFPVIFNVFQYKNERSYLEEIKGPDEKVLDVIVENNLFSELLDKSIKYEDENNSFIFFVGNKALSLLENKGYQIPILVNSDENGNTNYTFNSKHDIEKWKKEHDIPINLSSKETVLYLIDNDITIIRKILNNSNTRKLAYEMLKSKGFVDDIELMPYSLSYDEEYRKIKRNLIKSYSNISMDTTAKDDFVNIVLQTSIYDLLSRVVIEEDDRGNVKEKVIPGQMLLDSISELNISSPIVLDIDEENNTAKYKFSSDADRNRFFKDEGIEQDMSAIEVLIRIGKNNDLIYDIITDDSVKVLAQELILNNGINPRISISNWEYVEINNKNNWMNKYRVPEDNDPEEIFEYMRTRYEINEGLNEYEARGIMTILEEINKQGQRAYEPINLAYGIKDSTVAKIEEGKLDLLGVQVSIEPVRYYPMGETASHILGYLGKISQTSEIKRYIEEKGYLRSSMIGKIGVEQWFEDYLKGQDGSKYVEVDVLGNTINVLSQEKATPGNNLYLTIDAKLQKVAEDALKHTLEELQKGGEFQSKWGNYKFGTKNGGEPYKNATSGSVVAIDVKTGEVLAMANYPSYDPNLFATGISNDDWQSLQPEHEEDHLAPRPLYNIALQHSIQPGSTFKMITGLAVLQKGIKATTKIYDYGYVEIGGQKFGCWLWNQGKGSHGWEDLYDAIRDSCNYYFYSVTLGVNPRSGQSVGGKVEIEDIFNVAKDFGLNDKTGIEILGERSGGVPSTSSKTSTIKVLLRRELNQRIRYHIDDENILNDEKEISKIIEEIVGWAEYEVPLSRNEVIRRLAEIGVNGEKVVEGRTRTNLADIIKYDYLNQAGWKQADTLNISIGQGENAYTPIQMANYIATLANGGYKNKVSVADKIMNFSNTEVIFNPEKEVSRVTLDDYNYLNEVIKGMDKVSSEGTAKSIFGKFPVSVASKTGTAQNTNLNPITKEMYDDYAHFVAFAPSDEPQIAVYAVIYQGGSGGYAGPLVREVIAEYLGLNDTDIDSFSFENDMVR